MKFGLNDLTYKKICGVFSEYADIEEVIIYGSRALGTYKNGSDIDLTIKGSQFEFQQLSQILNDLDDLMLPYSIDLSIYSKLQNEELKDHINRVGCLFYSKTENAKKVFRP